MNAAAENAAKWPWSQGNPTQEDSPTGASIRTGGELEQEPVVVWEAVNPLEAQVVKGRLESAGIPAMVRGEALGAVYGFTVGSLAQTDVLVPAALADQANELLHSQVEWLEDEEGEATLPPETIEDEERN